MIHVTPPGAPRVTTTAAGPAVGVRCLGTFELTVNGRPVERWRAGKTRHLFQYLLMNRGQVVLKERLMELLWPESDTSPATSLRVAVHALRRILGTAPDDDAAPVRVTYQDVGYVLDADDIWLDVDEFAAACAEGAAAAAAEDDDAAVAAYQRAVELYTGDFLAQDDSDWVEEYRQWNRTQVLEALAFLRNEAVRRGDAATACHWSRRTLETDPYHENSYRTLMAVHARRGERGQVKLWFELCEQRLGELEVEPDPATTALYERAVAGTTSRPRSARRLTHPGRSSRPAAWSPSSGKAVAMAG